MESPAPLVGFESFGLSPELQGVLKELGYEEPTPIQRETLPHLLAGRDVLGLAATGTGKTAAFALPLVERLDGSGREPFGTRALVMVPTRELAMQVAEAIRSYGRRRKLAVAAVFGGQEIFHQVKVLKHGVDVVVATPGRVLDHLRRKSLKLGSVRFVVLDEADEMLDMGFAEDLETIFKALPPNRQTALFSATLPSRIAAIAAAHLDDPVKVTIAPRSMDAGTLPKIRQAAYVVRRELKESALIRLLDVEAPQSALIFCRTRLEVEALTNSLTRRSLPAQALHGGMTQEQRDLVLRRFKGGELRMLIATDVAARGLHVENLSHVINYDLPVSPEPYVHRIGRTGRAGREGVALSLLDPREMKLLKNIERVTRTRIPIEPMPGAEVLRSKREAVLAGLLKAALLPRTVEHQRALLAELTKEATLEEVASAALAVAMDRLFPPTDGDGADFAVPARKPFRPGAPPERDERDASRSHGRTAGPPQRPDRKSFRPGAPPERGERDAPRSHARPAGPPQRHERKPFHPPAGEPARPAPTHGPGEAPSRHERKPFQAPAGDVEARASAPAAPDREADEAPPPSGPRGSTAERRPERSPDDSSAREPHAGAAERRPSRSPERSPRDPAAREARGSAAERRPSRPTERTPGDPSARKPFRPGASRHEDAPERPPYVRKDRPDRASRGPADGVKLFISLGTNFGLRPQDVVGAIANEAGLTSRDIGPIEIGDEHSRVVVPRDAAPRVIAALKATTLRGRRFSVDLERPRATRTPWVDKKR